MDLNHEDIEMSDDAPAAPQQTLGDALKRVGELEAALTATQQEGIAQAQAHQTELSTVRQELAQSTAVSNELQSRVTELGSQVTEAIGASTTSALAESNATITDLRREIKAYVANRVTMEEQIQALEAAVGNEGGQDLVAMTEDRDRMQADRDEFHYQIRGENNPDSFEKTIERLRDQIGAQVDAQALQERNALLEEQIEAIEADLAALPTAAQWTTAQRQLQEYEELKLEHTDSQLLVASLERQVKDAKLDLAKADLELAQTSGGQVETEHSSQSQPPEAQNAELLLQVRTLEVRIAEQDVEITNLRTTQEEMEREAVRQQRDLQRETERAEGFNGRIAQLENDIESLTQTVNGGAEERETLITRNTNLEAQNELIQESIEDLRAENDLLEAENEELQNRNDELADNDPLLLQAIQENKILRDQLESGAVENGVQDELNEALEANIALEEKIEELEATVAKITPNDQSDETANHEKQIQQLRDHCAQEKEDLRAEIERLQNTLEKLSTDSTNEIAALNDRLAEALAQVTELETQKTDYTHRNEILEQQLLAARGSLQVSENALEKALGDLASCEENNESGQAHGGLLQCQAEVERLETALASVNGELADVKEAQATLIEQLEDVQSQLQLARESLASLQGTVQSQEFQNQEQTQALQQAQADLFACRQAHADGQGVLKIWGDRLHAYEEADKERAKTQNSEAAPVDDEALNKLQTDLSACHQEAAQKEAAHEQALQEIEVELAACRQQHTEDQNTIQDYQSRLEKMKRADNNIINSMEEDLNKAQADLAACQEQLEERPTNDESQQALDKAQEDLAACDEHRAKDRNTIQDLENQLVQLEHQLASHEESQNGEHDDALNKAQEDLAACLARHAEDLKTIKNLETQLEQIQQQETSGKEPSNSDHEQALNEAQEELAACHEQYAEDQNTIQGLKSENDEHRNAFTITQEELATYRKRVTEHEKNIQELQSQILNMEESAEERGAVHEHALNEARAQLAACLEQHKIDQNSVESLAKTCASMQKKHSDLSALFDDAGAKGLAKTRQDSERIIDLQKRLDTALAAAKPIGTDGSNDAVKTLTDRITELERELEACRASKNEMQQVINDLRETFTEDKQTIATLTHKSLEADERERKLEDELEVVQQHLLNERALHHSLQIAATMGAGDVATSFDAQIVSLMNQLQTSEEFRQDLSDQLYELKLNPNATEQQQAARITGLESHIEVLAAQIMKLSNTIRELEQAKTRAETEADQLRAQLPPEAAATGTDEPKPKPTPPHPRLILRSGRAYRRVPQPAPAQRNTTAPRPLYTGLPTASGGIRKRPSTKKKNNK